MKTVLSILVATGLAAAQVGYSPGTSYIYRSDNGGPGKLIDLSPKYQQPFAFAPPLPVARADDSYELAPAALPYLVVKPITEDAKESDEASVEDVGKYILNGGHQKGGGGSHYDEEHHSAHGEKASKGSRSRGHHAKGVAGTYDKEHNEEYFNKAEGKKGTDHNEVTAYGKNDKGGLVYQGGKHGHKSHSSKGEDITGYHKVYNKDEFKKDHDFFDESSKSGHFYKHGNEQGEHGSETGAHKKGGHGNSGYNKGQFGKSGSHAKGHVDEIDTSHTREEGDDIRYNHAEDYGKEVDGSDEKEYEYEDADEEEDGELVQL